MKTNKVLFVSIILMLFTAMMSFAQEKENEKYVPVKKRIDKEIIKIREQAKTYKEKKKEELKDEIEKINKQLEREKISEEEADLQKKNAAEITAKAIVAYEELMDAKIAYIEARLILEENDNKARLSSIDSQVGIFGETNRYYKKYKRTTFHSSFGFGYNYWRGDNLTIDDFSYKNNNYFQFGLNFKTLLNKDSGLLRIRYGLDFITHSTELNGSRAITIGGANTQIAPIGFDVDKAQFSQFQILAPIHLEIGGSERKDYEDGRVRFAEYGQWKAGIGGFVGFNIFSTLTYKFEQDGRTVRQSTTGAFDTNAFVYGVDAYVGHGAVTLFGRMNLNNVFRSDSVDAQYVSFGIRFQ